MIEDLYRAIIESADDPIFICDRDGRFTYGNPKAAANFGLTAEQFAGKTVHELFAPDVATVFAESVRRVIDTGEPSKTEDHLFIHGIEFWSSTALQPLRDATGGIVALVGIVRDITTNKQAELALQASEERLRQVIRVSNIGVFDIDFTARAVYFSPQQREIWGFSADEPLAWEQHRQYIHPDDLPTVNAANAAAHSHPDGVFELEHRIVRRSGEERRLIVRAKAIFDEKTADRRLLRVVGATRDITDEKRARVEHEEMRARLQQAVRIANIGIFELDFTAETLYWTPEQREIWGWRPDEPVGWNAFFDYIHPQDRDRVLAAVARVQESADGIFAVEHRIIRRNDGQERWIVVRGQNFFEGEGAARRTVRALGAVRDVTAEKLAVKANEDLQMRLAHSQKLESIGRLAGGIAHDFNNILSVIIGCAEMAASEPNPSIVAGYLDEILKAATRSADLTRQLLGFARRQTVMPRVLDLNDFVSASLKMLRRVIGEHVTLSWHPGLDLWHVRIDPGQVDQILVNLMANARDAIADDVGSVVIHTERVPVSSSVLYAGLPPGEYVRLAVVDNGKGMDDETQRHLFEPFYTTKLPGRGTGLGMASVDGIVRQNGGVITVESRVGKGTTVNVLLPRAESQAEFDLAPEEVGTKGGTETLLVVEDEPALLQLAKRALEMLGYTVLAAPDPKTAIDLAGKHAGSVDMLVTDVVLPGMNGRSLAERLGSVVPNLKCLFVSGYPDGAMGHGHVVDEHVHFLQKPFSPKALAEKVRQVLES